MSPEHLRAAASVLLALERLPATTPGINVTFDFLQPNTDGNNGWADIRISEETLRFGLGEHFYDPKIGGDRETRTAFETEAGGYWREGDIDDWLAVANVIILDCEFSADEYSDHDEIKWEAEESPAIWLAEP
jgi:hypothetical protein